jgi:hypothetical protein
MWPATETLRNYAPHAAEQRYPHAANAKLRNRPDAQDNYDVNMKKNTRHQVAEHQSLRLTKLFLLLVPSPHRILRLAVSTGYLNILPLQSKMV